MKTTTIITILAAGLFGLVACTTPPCCIDFNNSTSFPNGATYNAHNDSVYYSCGFIVRTDNLILNGVPYYNRGKLGPPPVAAGPFGSGNVFNTNNITLRFYAVTSAQTNTISFEYLDIGGSENLAVNGALYSGELKNAPANLGGVAIVVTSLPIPLPAQGNKGTVRLTGAIKEFKIGGQEFYLENVCWQ